MRGRGLKYRPWQLSGHSGKVAPYAGAWIEIKVCTVLLCFLDLVAPYAGAWIEIIKKYRICNSYVVAPYAGAWIEITGVFDVSSK